MEREIRMKKGPSWPFRKDSEGRFEEPGNVTKSLERRAWKGSLKDLEKGAGQPLDKA
ncbi:hypothetical protein ACWDGI_06130 [Streptomyces sp. NPDC001220]